jgi:hypothetical protein
MITPSLSGKVVIEMVNSIITELYGVFGHKSPSWGLDKLFGKR